MAAALQAPARGRAPARPPAAPPAPRRPGSGLGWAVHGGTPCLPPRPSVPSCPVLSARPAALRSSELAPGCAGGVPGARGGGGRERREGRGGRGRSALGRPLPAPETHSSPLPSSPRRGRGGGAPGCGLGRDGGRGGGQEGGQEGSLLDAERHGMAAAGGAGCALSAAPPGAGRALRDRRCPRCPSPPLVAAAIALFGGVSLAACPPSGLGARRAPALLGPGCEGLGRGRAAGSGRGSCAEPRDRAQEGPQRRAGACCSPPSAPRRGEPLMNKGKGALGALRGGKVP